MKVRRLKISGYRNLHQIETEFGDLTVLVGKNDAGKSNIIHAVELLMSLPRFEDANQVSWLGGGGGNVTEYQFNGIVDHRIFERDVPGVIDAEISFELRAEEWSGIFNLREPWVVSDHQYTAEDLLRLTVRWSIETDEVPAESSARPRGSNFRVVAKVVEVIAGNSLVLCDRGEDDKMRFLEEQKGNVLGYGTNAALMDRARKALFGERGQRKRLLIVDAERTIRPVDTFQVDKESRGYPEERIPDNLPEALAVYQDRVGPFKSRVLDSLQDDLQTLFPSYPSIRSLLEVEGGRRDVYFGPFPSTQVGGGVKQVLACLHEIRRSPADIVVVEEPEIHLHPQMQRAFFRYLRELVGHRQLILTSHSPSIVADVPLASVRLVRSVDGTAVVEQAKEENLRDICAELGIMPRDIFEFEAVLIVEGFTDELAFSELVRRDSEKHPEGLRVAVVPAGGWGSVGAYANASLLRRLGRRYLVVFDGDTDSEPRVREAKSSFVKRSGLDIHSTVTLKLATVEHYFVSPESLARAFPAIRRQQAMTILSEVGLGDLKDRLNALFLRELGRRFRPEDVGLLVAVSRDDEI